jgi:hypothetical protein
MTSFGNPSKGGKFYTGSKHSNLWVKDLLWARYCEKEGKDYGHADIRPPMMNMYRGDSAMVDKEDRLPHVHSGSSSEETSSARIAQLEAALKSKASVPPIPLPACLPACAHARSAPPQLHLRALFPVAAHALSEGAALCACFAFLEEGALRLACVSEGAGAPKNERPVRRPPAVASAWDKALLTVAVLPSSWAVAVPASF